MQFNESDYRRYVMMSHRCHLLVEGRDDKRLFGILFEELFDGESTIDIQSAEDFDALGGMGSREFVEFVEASIHSREYAQRFVAFVDREFREFEYGPPVLDRLKTHRVYNRLIWSRGHSIENYLFDFETVRRTIRAFCVSEYHVLALRHYKRVFCDSVRMGCAVTLASIELQKTNHISHLDLLKNSLNWECLRVDEGVLEVDYQALATILTRRMRMDQTRAKHCIEVLGQWHKVAREADYEVCRWLCHGHIGLSILWTAFGSCVYQAALESGNTRPQDEVQKVLRACETVRFNACLDGWCTKVIDDECPYPSEILTLFSLNPRAYKPAVMPSN